MTLGIGQGPDLALDPVELLDIGDRLVRPTGFLHELGDLDELASGVDPAGDLPDVALGVEPVIARERIGLDVALEVPQPVERTVLASTSGELIGDQRLVPPLASGVDPQPGLDGRFSLRIGILQRQYRVVGVDVAARKHLGHHSGVQVLEEFGALHQPVGHQTVGQVDPEALQAGRDPVQRQPVGELTDDQEREETGRGHALGERLVVRSGRPLHLAMAGLAGVLLALGDEDPDRRRLVAQMLARVDADALHPGTAARTGLVRLGNIDRGNLSGQVLQDPDRLLPHRHLAIRRAIGRHPRRRRIDIVELDARARISGTGEQPELIDIDVLVPGPELAA